MVVFLLKSSACLAVFLLFYILLLEKERMHTLKRFYLLAALLLALVIPSITFTEYVEVEPTAVSANSPSTYDLVEETVATETIAADIETAPVNHWPTVLWSLYGLGVLIFFLKFLFNLRGIFRNVRNNPKLKIGTLINVLLKDTVVPHTFFHYVFLNRKKFEADEIPKEVYLHEATHAEQKHSLDILFVELLQIVFWFNPLIYFFKKSIKLNHEFLADQAVLDKGAALCDYQNTLLTFASSANVKMHQPSMANAINYSSYSSIKKRFKVMNTRTTKKVVLLRSSLILPLFALLVMGFSESRTVEIINEDSMVNEYVHTMDNIEIFIDGKGQLYVRDEMVSIANLASFLLKFNTHLSKAERETKIRAKIFTDETAPKKIISELENILLAYGVAQIDILGPEKKAFPAIQNGATQKQFSEYNSLAKKYNAQPKEKRVIPKKDLKSLEGIYRKMSEKQKADAQPFPECPDFKPSQQEGATQKQIAEYNTILRKLHSKPESQKILKQTEVYRIKFIHSRMTNEQKEKAETFPKLAEWPLQEVATEKQMAEYNALAKKYNTMLADDDYIRIKKSDVDRLYHLHGIMTEKQRASAEPFPDFPEPPEPPALPKSPDLNDEEFAENVIEEIIAHQDPYDVIGGQRIHTRPKATTFFDMNDKDISIYFNGKEIDYFEMERMRKAGEITTINVSKNANGQEIINIVDLNKMNAKPSKSNQTSGKENQWTVTTTANRASRTAETSSPIPPVAPTIALHIDRENYSKELKNSITEYLEANKKYEKAIADYHNKNKGTKENLWIRYNDAMEKYVSYHVLAKEEGNFVQPVPAYKERIEIKNKISPAPPAPPKPKSPLDHVVEMAKKNAKFYYKDKEISSDKALEILKKNDKINIDSRSEKGKRPVVKLSTEPITIED